MVVVAKSVDQAGVAAGAVIPVGAVAPATAIVTTIKFPCVTLPVLVTVAEVTAAVIDALFRLPATLTGAVMS